MTSSSSSSSSLKELTSSDAIRSFCCNNAISVVTFSAHWCGPCRASKPQLQALATLKKCPMGICYEDTLGDDIHNKFGIRAFPTHVLFDTNGNEQNRVEGANIAQVQEMIETALKKQTGGGGGNALGGGDGHADARAARLARLEANNNNNARPSTTTTTTTKKEEAAKQQQQPAKEEDDDPMQVDDNNEEPEQTKEEDETTTDVNNKECTIVPPPPPKEDFDAELMKQLTEGMGFSEIRAKKGLKFGNHNSLEGAVEWIMQHQDDADIDEPIVVAVVAQSYKCNDCGKILSNMANLELHANKTGHSDFEESTERVKPLTPKEKLAKIAEIKELLKEKRNQREAAEKMDTQAKEIQRRTMGKEMAATRSQLEMEQRKRAAEKKRQEKQAFARERQRIRAELAKDKAERMANKGKLSSKLGVEGYQPDGIQYDVEEQSSSSSNKKPKSSSGACSAAKIDEYIQKVSSYKAGGDGGKCLKVLKAYVGNVADNPTDPKYQTINTENKAFKLKVKPFVGAKQLLLAVGFLPLESDPTLLTLNSAADPALLQSTRTKLEAALERYY